MSDIAKRHLRLIAEGCDLSALRINRTVRGPLSEPIDDPMIEYSNHVLDLQMVGTGSWHVNTNLASDQK